MHNIKFTRIALQLDKALIGMAAKMSVREDATLFLWQRFMPRRKEIQNTVSEVLYSVQSFSALDGFENFTPPGCFRKIGGSRGG